VSFRHRKVQYSLLLARHRHPLLPQPRSEKGKEGQENTTVVSLQMPVELVKVLDDISDAGAFRHRSDVILQAVRAFHEVSRRISRLETKRPVKNK
jgi:hypothetical protein